jgi:hypothetical protein
VASDAVGDGVACMAAETCGLAASEGAYCSHDACMLERQRMQS